MKKTFLLLIFLALTTGIIGQSPRSFNYQAVIRDSGGSIISGQDVAVQISILQGAADGAEVFSELHHTHTNEFGLINLQIGSVTAMENISWGEGPYFIRVSLDGEVMGVSQLLSVPFALHSLSSEDAFSGDYNDLTNAPDLSDFIQVQNAQIGDLMFYNAGSWQLLPAGTEGQVLSVSGGQPQWTDLPGNGNGGHDPEDPDALVDIDGNVYPTVRIGKQKWMAANLRTTRYSDGSALLTGLTNDIWNGVPDGAYAIYPHEDINGIDSEAEMAAAYGLLYNWNAVDDPRGLCPAGWRVPSRQDWQILKDSTIHYHDHINLDNIGNVLKSCRQGNSPIGGDCTTDIHPRWDSHNHAHGTDEFGFNGVPSGFRGWNGNYSSIGIYGIYWSSTSGSTTSAWTFRHLYSAGYVDEQNLTKKVGYPVRCIKDE